MSETNKVNTVAFHKQVVVGGRKRLPDGEIAEEPVDIECDPYPNTRCRQN
jgi:hypothetical protein